MADEIPDWAFTRMCELADAEPGIESDKPHVQQQRAFARYIAAHEEPPADPLEEEAAKMAEHWAADMVTPLPSARLISLKAMALNALKRGMELAGQP